MRSIALSRGFEVLVDDEDYEWLNQWKWHYQKRGYATRTIHINLGLKKYTTKKILMHRLILNADSHLEVDHIDNNKLNNQRSNLRLCTHLENGKNQTKHYNNQSGYKGVSPSLNKGKNWVCSIRINNQANFLGYFNDVLNAAWVYNQAAVKYFGEFASINALPENFTFDATKEKRKNNTTGVIGVAFHKVSGLWRAYIGDQNLGYFKNFEEAVRARFDAQIALLIPMASLPD